MRSRTTSDTDIAELLATLRTARFTNGIRCPRCNCDRVQRWGQFLGRQRYRCRGCGRTFSDLTGTPAAYIKKLRLWDRYADCMRASMSVRCSAARLGIHPTTAFRWRHRLLNALRTRPGETLSGWIELDTTRFPYSEKGQRRRHHPPRRRGLSGWERLAHPNVSVLIVCDRGGHLIHALCGRGRPSAMDLERAVAGRIAGRPTLCAEHGQFGIGRGLMHRYRGRFFDARTGAASGKDARLVHVRTARAAQVRLHDWIQRFRGVATKYLANYLVWHCHVDRAIRQGMAAEVLRWPLATTPESTPRRPGVPRR